MQLFIITALKEYSDQAAALLKKAGIHIFSATDIQGFKDGSTHNLLDDWFGAGEAQFDSILLFSFTSNELAGKAMELVKEYNEKIADEFPLRAFTLNVTQSSH